MSEGTSPRVKITELFFSIQGESSHAGRPCAFIRLTGCPLRCNWCDTTYSFHGGTWMDFDQILNQLQVWGATLVEVTGGEPLAQKVSLDLMKTLCDAGYEVLLETAGAHDIGPVDERVTKIVDVKCPGSGETHRNRWENLGILGPRDEVKFVIADRTDYEYARQVLGQYGLDRRQPLALFSPVHGQVQLTDLAAWILEDKLPVRMQLQLHKYIWGPEKTGV